MISNPIQNFQSLDFISQTVGTHTHMKRLQSSAGSSGNSGSTRLLPEGSMLPPGPSLVHLPEPMVWHFIRIARNVICEKFVPVLWRRAAKRRRERALQRRPLSQDRMAAERACEAALFASSEFVHSAGTAPELAYLLSRRGRLCTFQPGETISYEGEPCSAGVVVVLSGRVDMFQTVYHSKDSTRYVGFRGSSSRPLDDDTRSKGVPSGAMHANDDATANPSEPVDVRGVHHPQHLRFCAAKRKGLTCAQWTHSIDAPFVAGDLAVLNNEPRLHYMVAAAPSPSATTQPTAVDVMIIPQASFFAVFQALPNVAASLRLLSIAHTVRTANLPVAFPLTTHRLRQSPLLKRFSEEELQLLLVCARPRVYAKGTVLLERNRPCPHIVVIRRGLVEEIRERGGGVKSSIALWEGATFGEREAYFKERSDASYVAATNVDAYLVPMEEVTRMCTRSETLRARVAEAAKLLRVSDMHDDVVHILKSSSAINQDSDPSMFHQGGTEAPVARRYAELMRSIPLWRLLEFPTDLIEKLQPLWSSHLFSRGEYICRRSEVCSEMMIVLRGRAHIVGDGAPTDSNGGLLTVGECFGYTCLVEHRWQFSAIATEVTEVISLAREDLYDALSAWDAGHRSTSEDDPLLALQNAPVVGDGATKGSDTPTRSKFLQRLLQATVHLIQPLVRWQPAANGHRNAALDAAMRRAPNPNTFEALTIVNMHPISREEHVLLYPVFVPVRLRPLPTKRVAIAAREQLAVRNDAKTQLLAELEVHATKLQNRRASSVLMAEGNGQTLRRRSTLIDLSNHGSRGGTPLAAPKSTGAVSPRMPSSPSGRGAEAKVPSLVVPPSRSLVPEALPQDAAGNLAASEHVIHVNFLPRPTDAAEGCNNKHSLTGLVVAPQSPTGSSAVFDPVGSVSGGINGNASTISYGSTSQPFPVDDAMDPLGIKSGGRSGAAPVAQCSPSEAIAAQVERVASPLRGGDALQRIMRPVKPRAQSVQDAVEGLHRSSIAEERAPAAPSSGSARPTDTTTKMIRQVHMKPVTPRARKVLTYSASERYGSLMEAMMLAAASPRKDTTTTTTTTTENVSEHMAPHQPYMWRSTSVAAPLLASRPQSATLRSRVAEAHRSTLARSTTPADSPRCTAVRNRRVFGTELQK